MSPNFHYCSHNNTSSSSSSSTIPTCYFTYVPPSARRYSAETPNTPLSAYTDDISPDPHNPLLAWRPCTLPFAPAAMDASKLLQLQTQAAHAPRPSPAPLQKSNGTAESSSTGSSSSGSSSSSTSTCPTPPQLCCSRCRRTSIGVNGMIQFGTNLYYCSHCASMTGYVSAG
ncbi:uncharacterized protein EI97DRAFT_459665 [Westerdykella ornata]|uniref:Uncharacterized protein n=1 Tax=Westerdykella ornata TaxID=318751 RepID=A0A6A6JFC5_WESOR|nr:uncharacterized protein EI97DRAFT_459665 [Westerdykella ornata]KAF2275027.1 hypothetical protein EI97DRAFT_459665 [Westerdykella ornata]